MTLYCAVDNTPDVPTIRQRVYEVIELGSCSENISEGEAIATA